MASALPSKLVRPSAAGLVARTGLFERLDAASRGRMAWVTAPAGAGKTSLISSWIESRRLATLWYQVDAGDGDPATFFHYLGLGAPGLRRPAARRKPHGLPHLTPEYLPGLDVFVRRFFEALTAAAATPAVLVFDNYQDAGHAERLHQITNGAIDALPPGTTALFISRDPPPAAFARRLADPTVTLIDGGMLRLRDDEAHAIAAAQGVTDEEATARIIRLGAGWAAGLTLLARGSATGHAPGDRVDVADGLLGNYFATEVFETLDAAQQDVLTRLALAPRMSDALARSLCGEHAPRLLEALHARQLFVSRRSLGSRRVYEFHPLFRDFLRARVDSRMSAESVAQTRAALAGLLEQDDAVDDAIGLWIDAARWSEAARMIRVCAPAMLEQGRGLTLLHWLASLPDDLVHADGWLLYWRGLARLASDAAAAREDLQASCARFEADGDMAGELMGCGGVLNAYFFEQTDFTGAFQWADRLDGLYARCESVLPPAREAALISCLAALQYMGLTHPLFDRVERRARHLATTQTDAGIGMRVMPLAMAIAVFRGDLALARHWDRLFEELVGRQEFLAPIRIVREMYVCVLAWQEARHDDAYRAAAQAVAIGRQIGVQAFEGACHYHIAYTALSAGDIERATAALADAVPLVPTERVSDLMHLRSMQAMVLTLRGDLVGAIELLRAVVAMYQERSVFFGEATSSVQLGQALMLRGEHEEARRSLERALALARGMRSEIIEFQALAALAWSQLTGGDAAEGRTLLREALAIGARRNYMNCHPIWLPRVMSQLFAVALEEGIEVAYVQRFVVHRGLPAPGPELARWPWPIRVHALGRFELRVGERLFEHGRKEQRRLIELLKAIVAAGGEAVARQALADALWPEANGDAAMHAFEMTLHRLRKALGRDDAIVQTHGQVSLNREVVWVDALVFDRLVDRIEHGEAADAKGSERTIEQALELYRGHFLGAGGDTALQLAYRERLRRRFRRTVLLARTRLPPARAAAWMQRLVEIDPPTTLDPAPPAEPGPPTRGG